VTDQPAEITELTESTAPAYAAADDEELECDKCGWVLAAADNPVCESCYDSKEIDMDVDDVLTFANELNLLGDQIRDNRGDRERWWNKARDLAAEMRAWGKANAAA
jgi:hypothetical protein